MATDISEFDKDQLADYAKAELGIDLDLRKKIENLRTEVAAQQAHVAKRQQAPAAEKKAAPKFLLNRDTGMVFKYTDQLRAHLTNAIACDENGNPA